MTSGLPFDAVFAMIGEGRGKGENIIIPLVFVDWLESYEAAAMLTQVLHWTALAQARGRREFLRSAAEWQAELHLSAHRIDVCQKRLKQVGVVASARGHFDGSPLFAYTIDRTKFVIAYHAFLTRTPARAPESLDLHEPDLEPRAEIPVVKIDLRRSPDLNELSDQEYMNESARSVSLNGLDQDNGFNLDLNGDPDLSTDSWFSTLESVLDQESLKREDIYTTARTREGAHRGVTETQNLQPVVENGRKPLKGAIRIPGAAEDRSEPEEAHEGAGEPTWVLFDPVSMGQWRDPGPYGDYAKLRRAAAIHPNYDPGPNLRAWWEMQPDREGINLQLQVGAFIDYWTEKRRRTDDVDSMFRNWMRKKIHWKQVDHREGSGKQRARGGAPGVTKESYEAASGRKVTPARMEPVDVYTDGGDARKMRSSDVPREDVENTAALRDTEEPETRIRFIIRECGIRLNDTHRTSDIADTAINLWLLRSEPVETFINRLRAGARMVPPPKDLLDLLSYVEQGVI